MHINDSSTTDQTHSEKETLSSNRYALDVCVCPFSLYSALFSKLRPIPATFRQTDAPPPQLPKQSANFASVVAEVHPVHQTHQGDDAKHMRVVNHRISSTR